jgi:hypothetical protein
MGTYGFTDRQQGKLICLKIRGHTQTDEQTRIHRQQGDLISLLAKIGGDTDTQQVDFRSLLLFFQNKES